MTITNSLEFLCESGGLDFYKGSEVGFSFKKYAKEHKLYENFGRASSSTYYEIFNKGLYSNNLLEQIWVFDKQAPVALSIAVHFEDFKQLRQNGEDLGEILGQIHLYVKPEYRKRGIAAQSIAALENGFLKYDKQKGGFIVLQDDAMLCAQRLQHFTAIDGFNQTWAQWRRGKMIEKIKTMRSSDKQLPAQAVAMEKAALVKGPSPKP